jgi:hypothetical protein
VVYIGGRTVTSASVSLYSYTRSGGEAKMCVSKEQAVAAWRKLLKERGASADALASYDGAVNPRLLYMWSPLTNPRGERSVPTWVIIESTPYMVDGYTGRTWFND